MAEASPSEECHKQWLARCYARLVEDMEYGIIRDELYQMGIMTRLQREDIDALTGRAHTVR